MDETRVQALRYACIAMRGAPFTEITAAAESFEKFLRGNSGNCSLADMGAGAIQATQETVGQPSATDLSQADQTPYDIERDRQIKAAGLTDERAVFTWVNGL